MPEFQVTIQVHATYTLERVIKAKNQDAAEEKAEAFDDEVSAIVEAVANGQDVNTDKWDEVACTAVEVYETTVDEL